MYTTRMIDNRHNEIEFKSEDLEQLLIDIGRNYHNGYFDISMIVENTGRIHEVYTQASKDAVFQQAMRRYDQKWQWLNPKQFRIDDTMFDNSQVVYSADHDNNI